MNQIAVRNFCVGGKEVPAVTSLQVAESFEKEHYNVLRDIEAILPQVPENFVKLNFEVYEYPIETGIGTRMAKSYLLSKDAFTLLTMGYTGEKAMAFKVAYIARFNEMEEQIKQATQLPSNYLDALKALVASEEEKMKALETVEQQKPMVMVAEERIEKKGCLSITDVTKSLGLKRGQITNWAKAKGFIHKRLCEVNKAGEDVMDLSIAASKNFLITIKRTIYELSDTPPIPEKIT